MRVLVFVLDFVVCVCARENQYIGDKLLVFLSQKFQQCFVFLDTGGYLTRSSVNAGIDTVMVFN